MRLLFTFVGGHGHYTPLKPIAIAAKTAGHHVHFATQPTMIDIVEADGFTTTATTRDLSTNGKRLQLQIPNISREESALRDSFANSIANSRYVDILALATTYKPDVIICDEADFGSMLAAEKLGIPHVTVLVIASGSFIRPALLTEPLNRIRRDIDLPPDPELAMLYGNLVISPFPNTFRDPELTLPNTTHFIKSASLEATDTPPIPWITEFDARTTIYFTLGTIFNVESGDLFQRVLDGLKTLDANVIMTVGYEIDPAEFGPQPANIHIKRYLPMPAVLPFVDLVISHGGSGTVIAALGHGILQIVIPLGADQLHNADRVRTLNIGRTLDAFRLTPNDITTTIHQILEDQSIQTSVRRISEELATLPSASSTIPLIEQITSRL